MIAKLRLLFRDSGQTPGTRGKKSVGSSHSARPSTAMILIFARRLYTHQILTTHQPPTPNYFPNSQCQSSTQPVWPAIATFRSGNIVISADRPRGIE
ncbi:hypothetical protein I7I53_10052 [Histoplasma capsulatum var. duboisii H88]|uniref:Uncharacterized protein n=1 Tax=Ajellomyces capsulatus (strain H88) TaxID=544711 RepID=A0A8A1LAF1_AJEC8|nr:hypothetical protein I7I53_10052 [Histoplasma capsulatum var. duboisii H88]